MKKQATIIGGTLVLVMAMSGAAMAHGKKGQRGPGMDAMFENVDADNNGSITLAELEAAAAARFAKVDADSDGFVTAEEMAALRERGNDERRAKMAERIVERMDTDDDGKLSLEEMTAKRGPAQMLERLDADGNGELSKEEIADARGHRGDGKRGDKGGKPKAGE